MGEACYFTIWSGITGLFANFAHKVTKNEVGIAEKASVLYN